MTKKHIIGIVVLLLAVLSVCFFRYGIWGGRKETGAPSNRLEVAASFYPLYYFASEIGGEKAQVRDITPAGTEPHDYELAPQDVVNIEKSQILILNGSGLEAWGEDVKKNIGPDMEIVTVSDGLAIQRNGGSGENALDPHIWLSPVLAQKIVDRISESFEKADPQNADYYRQNATALKALLGDLDGKYKQGLGSCAKRSIITSHAAFGYLAAAYDFQEVPIAGLSPDSEPSPQQLSEVSKFVESNNIKYIFFESLVSPKLSQTIANETGAQTLVLNPLEGLGNEEIAKGQNYFTEMDSNLNNLKIAMECK